MTIYNYDNNGMFIRASEARLSPLDTTPTYLIPANATTITPPTPPLGYVPVFINDNWTLYANNIGTTVYEKSNKTPLKILTLGEIPVTHTKLVPASYQFWNGTEWEDDEVLKSDIIANRIHILVDAGLAYQAMHGCDSNMFALVSAINAVKPDSPKITLVTAWLDTLWNYIKAKKDEVTHTDDYVLPDLSLVGVCPHSFTELRAEYHANI